MQMDQTADLYFTNNCVYLEIFYLNAVALLQISEKLQTICWEKNLRESHSQVEKESWASFVAIVWEYVFPNL